MRSVIVVSIVAIGVMLMGILGLSVYEREMGHRIIPLKFDTPNQLIAALRQVASAAQASEDPAISKHAEAVLQHLIAVTEEGLIPDLHEDLKKFVKQQRASRVPTLLCCESPTSQETHPSVTDENSPT